MILNAIEHNEFFFSEVSAPPCKHHLLAILPEHKRGKTCSVGDRIMLVIQLTHYAG